MGFDGSKSPSRFGTAVNDPSIDFFINLALLKPLFTPSFDDLYIISTWIMIKFVLSIIIHFLKLTTSFRFMVQPWDPRMLAVMLILPWELLIGEPVSN